MNLGGFLLLGSLLFGASGSLAEVRPFTVVAQADPVIVARRLTQAAQTLYNAVYFAGSAGGYVLNQSYQFWTGAQQLERQIARDPRTAQIPFNNLKRSFQTLSIAIRGDIILAGNFQVRQSHQDVQRLLQELESALRRPR